MRAARSASPSVPPTSVASATWRAASRRATATAARAWAFRWRPSPGPTRRWPRWPRRRHERSPAVPQALAPAWGLQSQEGTLMSTTQSLLVELLVEELPPKALKRLGDVFAASLLEGLKSRGLAAEHAVVSGFATPRRLAAHVSAVHALAADQEVTRKVMPLSVALDASGRPTA